MRNQNFLEGVLNSKVSLFCLKNVLVGKRAEQSGATQAHHRQVTGEGSPQQAETMVVWGQQSPSHWEIS